MDRRCPEINQYLTHMVRMIQRLPGAPGSSRGPTAYGSRHSSVNDRKGGAFPIMLHQFRRAVGVAIVRGNAQHKLGRLHYVRATPEEAADACSANHSSNRWGSHRHGRSNWFTQHTPDGYGTYEQFRNGYDHCVP